MWKYFGLIGLSSVVSILLFAQTQSGKRWEGAEHSQKSGRASSTFSVHNASMGITAVQAWRCCVCGYEWLKVGKPPIRCASNRCRSRKWNFDFGLPIPPQGSQHPAQRTSTTVGA